MFRTLVIACSFDLDPLEGVWLFIPARDKVPHFCPRKAMPPAIYLGMIPGKRYHVGCNINTERSVDLCYDGWENE